MKRQVIAQCDAGYVRVSTDMQMERDALQNQVQALEAYAAAHSLKLRLYKDEGTSAKDTGRPDLQRLIATFGAVASGPCWSPSSTASAARWSICST